jgi:hypothetical protein
MAYDNLIAQLKLSYDPRVDSNFFEDIRKKLLTSEADDIVSAIIDYVDALKATNRARLVIPSREHPDWQAFLRSVAMNCETQNEKLESLRMMVYGERAIHTYVDHWTIYSDHEHLEVYPDMDHWTWDQ